MMDLNKANEKMHNLSNSWKLRWTSALGTFALAFGILVAIALSPVKADNNTGSDTDIENEFEGDAEAIEYGRLLFARRCAYCHGGGGAGAKGPSLTKGKFKYSRKALTSDLVSIIMGGIPNTQMGAFGRTVDGDETLKIIAYIRQQTAKRAAAEAEQAEAE